MKVPRYRWFLWAAFLAATLFFIVQMGFLPGGFKQAAPKRFELLDSLMHLVRNDYLEVRDPVQTAEGAYRGLVNSLDPLSAYLTKDLAAKYLAMTGKETDPGVVILKHYASFPQVASVVENSPAEKAGIKLGDLLSAIEGQNSLSMSMAETTLRLKGTDEQPVKVRVLRGNETLDLDVPRALLFPKPYTFVRAAGKPAILRIHRFAASLDSDLRREVLPALKNPKTALIIDLRNCQDGELEAARKFVNLFIKTTDAGSFENRGGAKQTVACPAEPELGALPLAVWVNAGTAGPAEFAAGVLQEIRKVKVVGFPTPGLVGRTAYFALKDESAILLTSGVFSLPSGRKLWDDGLHPDVSLPIDKLDEKSYLEKTIPLLPKL
ncbi:MAG TPA: S41 family peptidase [Candidatus Latescibacteria bacterium]|nr:S41 family peptidase [Candidatus Latescibacterota bacterium]